jgi:galactokinase
MDISPSTVLTYFKSRFGKEPLMVRAPGRINLIGEHTDYNDGFVMPGAVDREIWFAVSPSDNGRTIVHALQYGEDAELDISDPAVVTQPAWANYLLGVLRQLKDQNFSIQPFQCVVGGNIPSGAGMSSSAALECGFGMAMNLLNGHDIPRMEIARMGLWAEQHFVGLQCGIMDQFASTMGKRDHVMLLDCKTMEYQYLPFAQDRHTLILCDTRVSHSLADSEYNLRRQECEEGVRILQAHYPHIKSLRDVDEAMLRKHRDEIPSAVFERCSYVTGEIRRVMQAADALEQGDLQAFGELMFETHEGLSKLYEVSCKELDFLVEQARTSPGVLGARMMGGGFGGCTINLVETDEVEGFLAKVKASYREAFDREPGIYTVSLVEGAGRLQPAHL